MNGAEVRPYHRLILLLLIFLLLIPLLQALLEKEADGAAIDAVARLETMARQPRNRGRLLTDHACPYLRRGYFVKKRRPLPSCTGGLLSP